MLPVPFGSHLSCRPINHSCCWLSLKLETLRKSSGQLSMIRGWKYLAYLWFRKEFWYSGRSVCAGCSMESVYKSNLTTCGTSSSLVCCSVGLQTVKAGRKQIRSVESKCRTGPMLLQLSCSKHEHKRGLAGQLQHLNMALSDRYLKLDW